MGDFGVALQMLGRGKTPMMSQLCDSRTSRHAVAEDAQPPHGDHR